jgi:DNA polymerase-3 subunit delta'
MAPRRLFLVADAEELVAQESAQEAANALLKVLEEPPSDTWFVLTASEPGRLLPTIRSRVTAIYFPPLSRERVQAFLTRERPDVDGASILRAAELSGGSIGRALGFLKEGDEDGPLEAIRQEAFFLLKATLDGSEARFSRALEYDPFGARSLHEVLTSLQSWLRDLAAVAEGMDVRILNVGAREWLTKATRDRDLHPAYLARAGQVVSEARERAAGNVNPQLLITRLLFDLGDALVGIGRSRRSAPATAGLP